MLIFVPLAALLIMSIVGAPIGLLTPLTLPLAMMVATVLTAFPASDWLPIG